MKGIVQPIVTSKTPRIGPMGVLSATRTDLPALIAALELEKGRSRSLYMSQLHIRDDGIFLSGPIMGAPYAVMVLETLAAWGAKEVIFLGWCGAISSNVQIGDILVPTQAWIDEGTSRAYSPEPGQISHPSAPLTRGITALLEKESIPFHEGAIWTTDAIFRETPEKVKHFQDKGALAVEMELSALFTVSAFLGIALSAILTVSDDLSDLSWKPGFKDIRFVETRRILARAVTGYLNVQNHSMGSTASGA
jgi:purine-nucleoside phosphorylase